MGQKQSKTMTEEEKTQLSIGLLREWWISATESLVKDVGLEKALSHLKPYFYNTGSAGGQNIPRILGSTEDNTSQYNIGIHMWPLVIGGRINGVFQADDGSQIFEYIECGTHGRSKAGCFCMCQYTWQAAINVTNPGYELSLVRSLSFGDKVCDLLGRIIGMAPKVVNISEFKVPDERLPPQRDKDVWEYLSHAYVGECWSNATRAFIDAVGPDKAQSNLEVQMRCSGQSFRTRFEAQFGAGGNKKSIPDLIDLVQTLHQRSGVLESKGEQSECTIKECPFASSALPEICLQYEAFFNGICEAIDPSYEFKYDRMITKGDETCHWMIRKRGEAVMRKAENEVAPDDPARILAIRYAKGEISKEELEERMENLRKLGLVR